MRGRDGSQEGGGVIYPLTPSPDCLGFPWGCYIPNTPSCLACWLDKLAWFRQRESLRQSYRGVTKRDWEEMCFPPAISSLPTSSALASGAPDSGGGAEEGPERGRKRISSGPPGTWNPVTEARNVTKRSYARTPRELAQSSPPRWAGQAAYSAAALSVFFCDSTLSFGRSGGFSRASPPRIFPTIQWG